MSLYGWALLLHLFGMALVVGVVFFSLAFSAKSPLDDFKLRAIAFIRKYGIWGMGIVTISGLYMAYRGWDDLKGNYIFWAKMGLIVFDYLVAVRLIDAKLKQSISSGDANKATGLTTIAWISTIVFVLIVVAGFWLGRD